MTSTNHENFMRYWFVLLSLLLTSCKLFECSVMHLYYMVKYGKGIHYHPILMARIVTIHVLSHMLRTQSSNLLMQGCGT